MLSNNQLYQSPQLYQIYQIIFEKYYPRICFSRIMNSSPSITAFKQPPNITHSSNLIQFLAPFVIGGISGALATCLIQPIDTFKVQIQVTSQKLGKNTRPPFLTLLKEIKRQKGFKVLYTGLESAILRQLFYGSARLGSYNWTVHYCKNNDVDLTKLDKVLLAITSGAFGAIVGNPFDVALVRKQASINKQGQKTYKNTLEAFTRIINEEGILGLWTGIKITVLRVALINVGQLASKQILADEFDKYLSVPKLYKDNIVATLASVLTSLISLPADNIKVKIQKQHKNNMLYSGIGDCFIKTVQRQGPLRLWVGFWVYLVRGFPHSFVLIRVQQYLTEIYQEVKNERIFWTQQKHKQSRIER